MPNVLLHSIRITLTATLLTYILGPPSVAQSSAPPAQAMWTSFWTDFDSIDIAARKRACDLAIAATKAKPADAVLRNILLTVYLRGPRGYRNVQAAARLWEDVR